MIVRDAALGDFDAVEALYLTLHNVHVEGRPDLYTPRDNMMSEESFENAIKNEKWIFIVAEEEGEVLGMCFATPRERSQMVDMLTYYVDDIVVAEKARRRGVATALMQEVEHRAKQNGAVRLDLMVWGFNSAAKELYTALGMTEQRRILEKML